MSALNSPPDSGMLKSRPTASDPKPTLANLYPDGLKMIRNSLLRLSATLLAAILSVASVADAGASNLEQEVIAYQDARFRAMIQEDVDELGKLLADDLHYSHTKGRVESKAQILSTIETKQIDYIAAERRDIEVRLFGNTAVITGLSDMTLIWRGEKQDFTIRFLEVAHKVDSDWRLVAWQSVRFVVD